MGDGVHFDPTINLGNAISLVVFVGVLFRLHGDIVRQLTILNVKVETMWQIYTGNNRIDRAVQDAHRQAQEKSRGDRS